MAKANPLLVFRIGWMDDYAGPAEILGGGAYVGEHGAGGEMWNFENSGGRCYGYVMTRSNSGINLRKILHNHPWQRNEELSGVDIVFIARHPTRGQVVVGWYKDATVIHKAYKKGKRRARYGYLCWTDEDNAVLLPTAARVFEVKRGKGFPGQSNVWYGEETSKAVARFKKELREYMQAYSALPLQIPVDVKKIRDEFVRRGEKAWRAPKKNPIPHTGDEKCDKLVSNLSRYPHAFVIACVLDRQYPAKKVWAAPYKLKERIGDFEFSTLRKLSQKELEKHIGKQKDGGESLHRHRVTMAKCVHDAIRIIDKIYDGKASRIWSGKPSSAAVVYRFLQIHGVGAKIAHMAARILVTQHKIEFKDYDSIDISVDVQVERVLRRLGLVKGKNPKKQIINLAREFYPKFPGLIDPVIWHIGVDWCKASNPECGKCFMKKLCPTGRKRTQ